MVLNGQYIENEQNQVNETFINKLSNKQQEGHDGPVMLTWAT